MDRIDELIRQATHDCMGVPVLDKRQFAELIVQECLTMCQYNADDDDDQFDLGRIHQAKQTLALIKQHFGVEIDQQDA